MLCAQRWPVHNPAFVSLATVTVVVQRDGNLLGVVNLPVTEAASKDAVSAAVASTTFMKV